MSKPLELVGHLTVAEMEERFRNETEGMKKSHYHVIWLKAKGKTSAEIAEATTYKTDWVRRVIRRYNAEGPDSLGDRRRENGQEMRLSEAEREQLLKALQGRAPDGGLWNGPKVNQWIADELGKSVSSSVGATYLRRLGFTIQTPRPRHMGSNAEAHVEFKKNCRRMWLS
jgi:transposase